MAGIEPAYWLLQEALPPYIGMRIIPFWYMSYFRFRVWHNRHKTSIYPCYSTVLVTVSGDSAVGYLCHSIDNNTFSYEFSQSVALFHM